ncbi:MAG: hypothetical protein LBH48_03085 [Bifidobacteriaceae bacterium]|nr:hypothetical protein [Bifidobacteriaceae bacterium]
MGSCGRLRRTGRSVAIDTFGLPGDGQLVLNHFGFTPENIAAEAKATLET